MAAIIFVDFQNWFILILLCFFSLLCYSLFFKKPNDSRGCDLPPSPPALPIIGHLHLLLSALTHKSLQKLSSKYGPLLHVRIFNVPIILVSSASVAYEIFKSHDVNVSTRGLAAIDESLVFGSSGIVNAPYGDYWKFMKKLIANMLLRPQSLERSRGIRAEELQRFYSSLLEKARKNESVEISKEAMKLINNTLCRMSMGRSFSEENGEAEKVRSLVDESYALTKKMFLASLLRRPLKFFRIPLFKKEIMSVSDRFGELLERILVEHKEKLDEKDQGKDMMDVLLTAYGDENAEYKITRNHIKSFFVELFVGGTDTSVQTTQWTMAEIINNPEVLERLREEIDSVVGKSRLVQETDIPNLPYLQAVVKEGLRLHPPGPLLVRTFQERCEIKGLYIPEKTTLVINAYAVMRDPDSWEDPDEFKPERFLSPSRSAQEDEKEQTLKYLPFGSGRRGCPGGNLAHIFVGTAIGVMVQCFDWKIEGVKVNMEETFEGMNLSMVHPLKCVPVPRSQPFYFTSNL
uniref:Cytochrome P450 705A18-2 n=1 Tax=Isatis tinctoria TaxID=161756 RepID=A0A8F0FS19_ISATI|nr:cytochrome P450 705A18-2 [Isatis tinctoria]